MLATRNPGPWRTRWTLLRSVLKVGFIGFGGGSALIPVVENEVVRHQLADAPQFTQHTVTASVTPGALPVKLAALLGWQHSAFWALVCAGVMALPGTLGTLVLLASIHAGGAELIRYVEYASVGITAFIIALLIHYIVGVVRSAQSIGSAMAIMLVTACASGASSIINALGGFVGLQMDFAWPQLSSLQVILIALTVMLICSFFHQEKGQQRGKSSPHGIVVDASSPQNAWTKLVRLFSVSAVAIGLGFIAAGLAGGWQGAYFLLLIALSTLVSFGGGEAYVAVADSLFVGSGWVEAQTYYGQIVPIANALPGPILIKIASALAMTSESGVSAWVMAGAALVITGTVCTLVAGVVLTVLRLRPDSLFLSYVSTHILPVVSGLLLSTCAAMVNSATQILETNHMPLSLSLWCIAALIAVLYVARQRKIVNDIVLIVLAGSLSAAVFLA